MVKNLPANAEDTGSVPGSGRTPGESESESHSVVSYFATLVHGILQVRILEWVAFPFQMEPKSPALQVDSLPAEPQRKPRNTGVGSLSLLQQIFPNQKLNQCLLHFRQDSLPTELSGKS